MGPIVRGEKRGGSGSTRQKDGGERGRGGGHGAAQAGQGTAPGLTPGTDLHTAGPSTTRARPRTSTALGAHPRRFLPGWQGE